MTDVPPEIEKLREQAWEDGALPRRLVVDLSEAVAAVREADQHLRDALERITRLVKRWDAPLRHDVDDRFAYEKWAAVGSEAHKIAVDALAASSRDTHLEPAPQNEQTRAQIVAAKLIASRDTPSPEDTDA